MEYIYIYINPSVQLKHRHFIHTLGIVLGKILSDTTFALFFFGGIGLLASMSYWPSRYNNPILTDDLLQPYMYLYPLCHIDVLSSQVEVHLTSRIVWPKNYFRKPFKKNVRILPLQV